MKKICKVKARSPHDLDRDSIHRRIAKQLRMSSSMPSRLADAEQTLDLPPGYTLVPLRELGDAFVHGCAIASDAGAGALVWVRRYDLVEFAVVLEPDEPLLSARRALFAGMNAVADAIAAHCPPERDVGFGWPDAIVFDGGLLGGARLGWPTECAEGEVPAWLVFGVILRAAEMAHVEEVQTAAGVSLLGEGFAMIDTDAIIGSFARHLMTAFDRWNERGFEAIARDYLERLPGRKAGERRTIDLNGDLLVGPPAGSGPPERSSLVDALAKAAWYDPQARGPKFG
jgi:biotin-(acetyl-CoA carboxylase) ligase